MYFNEKSHDKTLSSREIDFTTNGHVFVEVGLELTSFTAEGTLKLWHYATLVLDMPVKIPLIVVVLLTSVTLELSFFLHVP